MKHNYACSGVCSGEEELANSGPLCVHTSELAKTRRQVAHGVLNVGCALLPVRMSKLTFCGQCKFRCDRRKKNNKKNPERTSTRLFQDV